MKTPRILFIQTPRIWLSLLCTSAMLLTACGGGGGGSNGAAPANTTPTRITVIDGYLQGAVVCVDKNNNSACDPGETQGSTDASGRVVLNIPKADVGKYPIVAAVPASAVDSDQPGKTVGKAYTLKAPKDSPNNVTPLTTLVQHMVETDSSSTEEATTFVVNQTGVQQPLDDFINRGDSQTRTLARTLAALLQDRLNALSDNSVNSTLNGGQNTSVFDLVSNVTVVPVVDLPVNNVNAFTGFIEDTPSPWSNLSVTYPPGGDRLTVTLSVEHGKIDVATDGQFHPFMTTDAFSLNEAVVLQGGKGNDVMENTKQSDVTYKWVAGDAGTIDNSSAIDYIHQFKVKSSDTSTHFDKLDTGIDALLNN